MSVLLVDTNVVSILFNRWHSLRQTCLDTVTGHQLMISFITRAELMLWPAANGWGEARRAALAQHVALYLTLSRMTAPVRSGRPSWTDAAGRASPSRPRMLGSHPRLGSGAALW